jgi:hypothetical protein
MSTFQSAFGRSTVVILVIALFAGAVWAYFDWRETWPRSEALGVALNGVIGGADSEKSLVARVILDNFRETRANASRWSGIYWGFTFFAAAFSALAALILKVESFLRNEGIKKDVAALLSVVAALLVTISTSGDFQRKWQANRVAAAELEFTGYRFLQQDGAEPRGFLASVGDTLLRRQLAIAGSAEKASPRNPK